MNENATSPAQSRQPLLTAGGLSWRRRAFWVAAITTTLQLLSMFGPAQGGGGL